MEERELRALVGPVKAGENPAPYAGPVAGAAVRRLRLDATSLGKDEERTRDVPCRVTSSCARTATSHSN